MQIKEISFQYTLKMKTCRWKQCQKNTVRKLDTIVLKQNLSPYKPGMYVLNFLRGHWLLWGYAVPVETTFPLGFNAQIHVEAVWSK